MLISRRIPISLALPVLQVLIAIPLWLYAPFQYRKELADFAGVPRNQMWTVNVGAPPEPDGPSLRPPCERLLYIVNLPAFVLSNKSISHLHGMTPAIQFAWRVGDHRNPKRIEFSVGMTELIFVVGVALSWFWIGDKIDRVLRARALTMSVHPSIRWAETIVVFAVSSGLFWYCYDTTMNYARSERQIGFFGLIWPLALAGYVMLGIRDYFRRRNISADR